MVTISGETVHFVFLGGKPPRGVGDREGGTYTRGHVETWHRAWCKADTHVSLSLTTKMENRWEMASDKNSEGEQLHNEPKYSYSALTGH